MISATLNAVGPVMAAELGLSARNETARRLEEPKVVTVEVVRPVDASTKAQADADVLRSVPTTQRLLIDISV